MMNTATLLNERVPILQSLAKEFGCSVDSLIVDAVDNHIEKLKEKQLYDRRAIQSWEHYQETGMHITLNEFSEWVENLDTDVPQEKPLCHK
ncbi:MAG: hypothetical protein KGV56_02640 [Gammaproteobacteria bacterium]|nr:hypothetical protein [Gammaproteobacteria bacterium]